MGVLAGAHVRKGAVVALAMVALAGCAAVEPVKVVNPGDSVGVKFTCRLPNGDIAVSTSADAGKRSGELLSPLFVPRDSNDPVVIDAGTPDPLTSRIRPMEEDVLQQLRPAVLAMKTGETRNVVLHASRLSDRKPGEGIVKYNRTLHYAKTGRIPLDVYKQTTGREPAVGDACTSFREPAFKGVVTAIKDNEVDVTYTVAPGGVVSKFYGSGAVTDAGDDFVLRIDAEEGRLVRNGLLTGRIVKVTSETVHVDYGDVFGGEPLTCAVTVDSVTPAPLPAAEKGAAAPSSGHEAVKAHFETPVAEGGGSGKSSADPVKLSGQVAKGDLVTVRFTVKDADGTPVSGFAPPAPRELMAGREEVFPGLGEAIIGMTVGEKKEVALPPEKGFGPRDPAKTATYPVTSETPVRITLPAEEYVKRFGGFPTAGKEVPLFPYMTARVETVGEKDVALRISARDGERFEEPFGTVTVSVGPDAITLKLAPRVGAPFTNEGGQGVITAADGERFTVDYNHPLAGKTLMLGLEALSLTKASALQTAPVTWIENHDAGLAEAKKEGKPVFLILYADWCKWCKKTFSETLPDPRIGRLRDRFVWMKLNSDKEQKYKQMFGQNSFPMMVLLGPDGKVLKKIEGYRDAAQLQEELKGILN